MPKATSARRRGRPAHGSGNLLAVYVAVEWKRDQSKSGRRHSVKRACELLASEIESLSPNTTGDATTIAADPQGWSRIKDLHRQAILRAREDGEFRDLLASQLEEIRRSSWSGDELVPALFVGGCPISMWLRFSDWAVPKT